MKRVALALHEGRRLLHHSYSDPLLRNTTQLLASGVISALLGFVFLALAARFYTAEVVGITTAGFSAAGLMAMFSTAGMHIAVLRFLPTSEDRAGLISTVYVVTGLAAVLLMLVFLVGVPLWSPRLMLLRQDFLLAALTVLAALVLTLLGIQHQAFVALRRAFGALIQQSALGVLRILLMLGAVGAGVSGLMGSWALGALLALVVGSLVLRRWLPGLSLIPRVKLRLLRLMTRFLAVAHTAELLAAAPNFLLPLMVVNILGPEANAYFFVPFSILSRGVLILPSILGWTLLAEGSHHPEKLRSLVVRALALCMGAILIGLAGVFLLGAQFLALFGADYSANSLAPLWILSVSALPIAFIEVYIAVCRVLLNVRPTLYIYASVLPLVTIPSYLMMTTGNLGILGTSLGWTAGQGAVGLAALVSLVRLMRRTAAADVAPEGLAVPSAPPTAHPQDAI